MGVGFTHQTHRLVERRGECEPLLKKQGVIATKNKKHRYVQSLKRTTRYFVVFGVIILAMIMLGTSGRVVPEMVTNLQIDERHEHEASSAVQSRSIFTCVLCVIAALIILLPRLAWGPDDINGVAAGAGVAEEHVTRELGAGLTLLVPWLLFGVLYDLSSRSLLTTSTIKPFILSIFEFTINALVAFFSLSHDKVLTDRFSLTYLVLGIFQFIFVLFGHFSLSQCSLSPSIVSVQVALVMIGTFILALFRHDDQAFKSVQKLGVPNIASFFALIVALGGVSIIAVAESPALKHCFIFMLTAQFCAAFYFLGLQHAVFASTTRIMISQVFFQTSFSACFCALGTGFFFIIFQKSPTIQTPTRAPILVLNCLAFLILTLLSLIIIRRFSALVLLLFAALRAVLSLFTQAGIYHDTLTALEYKGAMILVLGLAIYALEVSKVSLDASDIVNGLAPSRFLEDQVDHHEDDTQSIVSDLDSEAAEEHKIDSTTFVSSIPPSSETLSNQTNTNHFTEPAACDQPSQ